MVTVTRRLPQYFRSEGLARPILTVLDSQLKVVVGLVHLQDAPTSIREAQFAGSRTTASADGGASPSSI